MSQKGLAPILIVILIALALGIGGYFVYQNQSKSTTPVPTPPPQQSLQSTPAPSTGPTSNTTSVNISGDRIREDIYKGTFEVQGAIIPGRTVNLIFRIEPMAIDLPNTTINFILPKQIKLISGDIPWQGNLKLGVPVEQRLAITVDEVGEWEIRAVVKNPKGPAFERVYYVFLNITQAGGTLSTQPTQKEYPTKQPNQRISP